ncbi:GHMP kinase [Bradyrhizobium sp. Gha]|uniref:GHMP family kinase ATP-binding protein n=1 Tax=Bradyrhizobium sp. Gha TaxID=1855318 RepID=UPI0008E78BB1|nr:GHMP kinase [Bradyrhizobium sp. Gha]SFK16564.1 Protein involved in propanediol utilization [Bradyrhizobium sp. Gha]
MLEDRLTTGMGIEPTILRQDAYRHLTPERSDPRTRPVGQITSVGSGLGHHGEILQGAFRDAEGRIHRGLVSLLCPIFNSVAWVLSKRDPSVDIDPPEKSKALSAVALLLRQYGERAPGLSIRIRNNIPIGYGLGSSTADVVSTLKAAARALGVELGPVQLFKLAVTAEQASDGTMFTSRAVLAAHREGIVIQNYERQLPPMGLISTNCDPQNPLLTLDFSPARYEPAEIDHFDDLRRSLARAIAEENLSLLASVGTESALVNQRYLPQPGLADVLDIARANGALGIQVAHSGRMIGVILHANLDRSDRRVLAIMSGVEELGMVPMFISRL